MVVQPTIGPAAEVGDGEITPDVVSQYFTDTYRLILLAHERWRTAIWIIQVATSICGVLLIVASVYLGYREAGAIGSGMIEPMGRQLFLLLPGLLMLAIGSVAWLWKFGWELPAGLVALVTAAEMFFLQLGNVWFTVALFLGAIGAIVYGIHLRFKKRDPLQIADLEQKLDAYIDKVIAELPRKVRLPVPVEFASPGWQVLRAFPNGEHSGSPDVLCKIGSDGKPRTSPAGVAAFELKPDTLVVFEATVDLRTGQPLYARAEEFTYGDIVQVSWTNDAVVEDVKVTAAGRFAAGMASAAAAAAGGTATPAAEDQPMPRPRDRALRHRMVLEIALVNGRALPIAFWDSGYLSRGSVRSVAPIPVTDPSVVSKLWQQILERRAAARRGSPPPAA
jgi:hypothetical protein